MGVILFPVFYAANCKIFWFVRKYIDSSYYFCDLKLKFQGSTEFFCLWNSYFFGKLIVLVFMWNRILIVEKLMLYKKVLVDEMYVVINLL